MFMWRTADFIVVQQTVSFCKPQKVNAKEVGLVEGKHGGKVYKQHQLLQPCWNCELKRSSF